MEIDLQFTNGLRSSAPRAAFYFWLVLVDLPEGEIE
jgi:hypothetical protein